MNQNVPYGYYDPYSPRQDAGPSGPVEQHGRAGPQSDVGASLGPTGGVQGGQPQGQARSQQQVQPQQQMQPPTRQQQGRTPGPQGPPAGSGPPGTVQMGGTEASSSPPPAAGAGPQSGPAPAGPAMGAPQPAPAGGQQPPEPVAAPLVDVLESGDELVVVADLPGFEEDDITIQADDTTLVIRARREDDPDEEDQVRFAERPRRLERVMQLPPNGNIDEASATHDNGVCTVTIPIDGPDKREIGFH